MRISLLILVHFGFASIWKRKKGWSLSSKTLLSVQTGENAALFYQCGQLKRRFFYNAHVGNAFCIHRWRISSSIVVVVFPRSKPISSIFFFCWWGRGVDRGEGCVNDGQERNLQCIFGRTKAGCFEKPLMWTESAHLAVPNVSAFISSKTQQTIFVLTSVLFLSFSPVFAKTVENYESD